MAVSNGQLANQTTFNNALLSRTVDSSTVGVVALLNALTASGATVSNIQRELNALCSFLGKSLNSVYNDVPTWSNNDLGTSGDSVKTRADYLTAAFNETIGHSHDGSAGGGAPIAAGAVGNVRLRGHMVRGTNLTSVTGGAKVVTTEMSGKTPSAGDTSEGVVVTGENRVLLRDATAATQDDQLRDSDGDIIFGRLTYAAGVWTITFYANKSGTPTAHSFTAANIAWYYQELFNPITNAPIYSELVAIPSDNATQDVIDATASLRGLMSAGTQTLGGAKTWNADQKFVSTIATQRADVASTASITALSSAKSFEKLTGSTATALHGITAGVDGQILSIHNGATADLVITRESGSASAANRIILHAATLTVEPGASVAFIYDTGQSRWVLYASASAGVGGGAGKGIVTISPSGGDGADYTFSDTADYEAAADDARISNGGILVFMDGTYTFTSSPDWRSKIRHLGASKGSVTIQLPSDTSTGLTSTGDYFFEDLAFECNAGFSEGYSTDFDGVNEYYSIDDDPSFDWSTDLTVSFWFKGGTGNEAILFGKVDYAAGKREWFVERYADGPNDKLALIVSGNGSSAKLYRTSMTVLDNTWHHYAFTWDSGTLKVYVDGAEDTSVVKVSDISIGTSIYNSDAKVGIAAGFASGSPALFFDGQVDEAAIYLDVLTALEIAEIYNGGVAVDLSGLSTAGSLLSWWKLGDSPDSNTTSFDQVGSNDATGHNLESGDLVQDSPEQVAGAGTHLFEFVSSESLTIRNCEFDSSCEWSVQSTGDHYFEHTHFGGAGDMSGATVYFDGCESDADWLLDGNSKIRATDSAFDSLSMSTAATNSGAAVLDGCTVGAFSMGGSSFWTNCRFAACALPTIPAGITGRFAAVTPLYHEREFFDLGNLTGSQALNLDTKQSLTLALTLTGNVTFTAITNPAPGKAHRLKIIQDGTGGRTITWPAEVKWPGGTAPTLSTGAGDVDMVTLVADGSGNLYGTFALDFS